jgi:DNA polymerase-1
MDRAYPRAMAFLRRHDEQGRAATPIRTYGGRLVRADAPPGAANRVDSPAAAARGRFLRNAAVQGAAAELFKMWAVTVRAGLAPLGGQIVLCLHDELLVHVPQEQAAGAAGLVRDALTATAARWAAGSGVRFVADVSTVTRWSDAK